MQTHREHSSRSIASVRGAEEGEEDARSLGKSAEIIREDGRAIRQTVEGELRGSESPGDSPLILNPSEEETRFDEELAEDFMQGLRLESMSQEHEEEEEEGDGEEEEEGEFEFAIISENPDGSLITAEEAFENGHIRPFYPVFGRNILQDEDASQSSSSVLKEWMGNPSLSSSSSEVGDPLEGLAEGTYCVWRKGKAAESGEGECRKSNSTGFSKLWRVKDLVMRSNSDGKDVFVFLNPKKPKEGATMVAAAETKSSAKSNAGKAKAATVAVRKDGYGRGNKNRRRSYLPYRVGFFTNINGMSRNVHPY